MGHASICILVALALPRLICGRPATADDGRSILNMLESRVSKPEDFSESKAISSLISQEDLSFPARLRQRRLSDQRRAELETLMTLTQIKRSLNTTREQLDPVRIGRRRRFAVDQAPTELAPQSIKAKHIGDPAYPLIS